MRALFDKVYPISREPNSRVVNVLAGLAAAYIALLSLFMGINAIPGLSPFAHKTAELMHPSSLLAFLIAILILGYASIRFRWWLIPFFLGICLRLVFRYGVTQF
jgi:hypothetical protein